MLFVLLPSLQFTDDISSKHTHLFQIRGKDTTFLSQISGNSVKVCCKSGATRQKHTQYMNPKSTQSMPISLLLSQLTDCSLINPRIHEVLEIRIIKVCLHKLCFLLQHGSYDSFHWFVSSLLANSPSKIFSFQS